MGEKKLLSQAPPCFGRHVKPLVPATFPVVSTHQPALGPPLRLWPVLLVFIKKACAPAVATLIPRRTSHNPPRGPSADWWVLTTANATGANGLTCLPKHEGARDIEFLAIHPKTGLTLLSYRDRTLSALTAGTSSSSQQ
jgi:hypothetical protein